MIFEYMKENNITNFGYVILFEEQPSLSILLENHELFNDIVIDSDEGVYGAVEPDEMFIVGVTIYDEDNQPFSAENLDDENLVDMTYNVTPLFRYKAKTQGLMMEDFVDLDLMNMLFYDVLDEYIQERIT